MLHVINIPTRSISSHSTALLRRIAFATCSTFPIPFLISNCHLKANFKLKSYAIENASNAKYTNIQQGDNHRHNFHLQRVVICIHSMFRTLSKIYIFGSRRKVTNAVAFGCSWHHQTKANNRNCVTRWATPIDSSFWADDEKTSGTFIGSARVTHAAEMLLMEFTWSLCINYSIAPPANVRAPVQVDSTRPAQLFLLSLLWS